MRFSQGNYQLGKTAEPGHIPRPHCQASLAEDVAAPVRNGRMKVFRQVFVLEWWWMLGFPSDRALTVVARAPAD